jgi:ABC-type Fe3+/spermidine/putrescine transport system ATPase subunit
MHEMGNGRILECEGLKKSYGDRVAVDGVGFVIARGETYGLLGPNGAGKTTTISMICGLLTRDAGAVIVDGKPMDTNSVDAKAAIGYVPQDLAIYPDLTGRENLNFFGQLYAIPRRSTKTLGSKTFTAVGMAVFFLFFTAQFGVLSLLGERRDGTLARLLAAPISPGAIVTAKALSTFVLGTVSMVVLVVASTFLLGADWGDPVAVGVLILAGVVAAMGLTSLIGGFAQTDEQAAGYSSIVAVVLGILGGTFFPLSQAPGLLANLTLVTPHYWLMRGFGDLAPEGAGVADILPSILALLAFGCVLGVLALRRARWMVVRK